jgi:hypothetical protein
MDHTHLSAAKQLAADFQSQPQAETDDFVYPHPLGSLTLLENQSPMVLRVCAVVACSEGSPSGVLEFLV